MSLTSLILLLFFYAWILFLGVCKAHNRNAFHRFSQSLATVHFVALASVFVSLVLFSSMPSSMVFRCNDSNCLFTISECWKSIFPKHTIDNWIICERKSETDCEWWHEFFTYSFYSHFLLHENHRSTRFELLKCHLTLVCHFTARWRFASVILTSVPQCWQPTLTSFFFCASLALSICGPKI